MLSFFSQLFKSTPPSNTPQVEIQSDVLAVEKIQVEANESPCAGSEEIEKVLSERNEAMQQIFQMALRQFVGCKAIACVDIQQNKLLAIESIECLPPEVLPFVAAATTDLFSAPNMVKVAQIFKDKHYDNSASANFNEIIVNGRDTVYLLLRIMSHQNLVCVFSCKDDGNTLGMLLHEARALMSQIETTV